MNTTPIEENKPQQCADCGRLQHQGEAPNHSGMCQTPEAITLREAAPPPLANAWEEFKKTNKAREESLGLRGRDIDTVAPNVQMVDSAGDERTVNNVMRHAYRVLNDDEKKAMQAIKDLGLQFHDLLENLGNSRELSLAKTKIEEAVMWGVKHLTK